jgi:ABC-type antimicrobial peptide transport system permease subunit
MPVKSQKISSNSEIEGEIMSTIGAIVMFVVSLALFKMGFGTMKDSSDYEEYGVESGSLHKVFSWFLIGLGAVSASIAGLLIGS